MSIVTFEGVVENGQIRLNSDVRLPDKTKVYVVVPDFENKSIVHVFSPHLVNREQGADFRKEIIKGLSNDSG